MIILGNRVAYNNHVDEGDYASSGDDLF
jgi:hypothetical protein